MKPLEPIPSTLRVSSDLLHTGVCVAQKARVGVRLYAFSSSGLNNHTWACNVNNP